MEYEASARHDDVDETHLDYRCFLFGESFFVPGAMWLRLVVLDQSGRVFGARRYRVLAVYLLLTVVIPIIGMVGELD